MANKALHRTAASPGASQRVRIVECRIVCRRVLVSGGCRVSLIVDMVLKMPSVQSDFLSIFQGLSFAFTEWPAEWASAASTTVDSAPQKLDRW